MRQELVERRVEEADGDGEPAHDGEQLDEVGPLVGQELGERRAPPGLVLGEDHLAHGDDAVALEEHVLRAAEADALGPEGARRAGVERRLGVGAHLHPPRGVGPAHQGRELAGQLGLEHPDGAEQHLAGGAVDQ